MELKLFRTLWGTNTSDSANYRGLALESLQSGFDGMEGQIPDSTGKQNELREALQECGLFFISEITTGGTYVPNRFASIQQHLDDIERGLNKASQLGAVKTNCIAGCDAWALSDQEVFFSRALELAEQFPVTLCFETHRSRSLFNPWITRDLVKRFPNLNLTCDFSHWCVVCERLIDTEEDVLDIVIPNAMHTHARVGYDQGPQVTHPAAPEYANAMRAHMGWWERIWQAHVNAGHHTVTMTPEFGPDGYLHTLPFTQMPVADLWKINTWMLNYLRKAFQVWSQHHHAA